MAGTSYVHVHVETVVGKGQCSHPVVIDTKHRVLRKYVNCRECHTLSYLEVYQNDQDTGNVETEISMCFII